jgi:hypothetical protein
VGRRGLGDRQGRGTCKAFPALFEATEPDPLDAALRALYAAAVTFGRDRYRALFEEVRAAYNL